MRRAVFSDLQRKGLERRFQIQKYISKPDRKKLAEKLGLKDSQVIVKKFFCLFHHERTKFGPNVWVKIILPRSIKIIFHVSTDINFIKIIKI